jgi:hypothetical protein
VASGNGSWKSYAVAAGAVLVVLATTGIWNPFPKLWGWVNTSPPIAPGTSQWQQQLSGSPQSVMFANDTAIVAYRTSVESYGLGAGIRLWTADADWASVAGGDGRAVVVTGKLLTKGYQVRDPRSDQVLRSDTQATAVWTFQDAVLDLHCVKGGDCTLTAWDPRGSRPMWTVPTGNIGFVLHASNPDLPDTQPLTSPQVAGDVAGAPFLPGMIGLPDNGQVRVIDTAAGRIVRTATPGTDQRIAVAGGRILTVTGTAQDGTCYYSTTATDPPSGGTVWTHDTLNLRTAENGSSCKQTRDPAGGSDVVLGVDPVGRRELIAAHDGRVLWHGDKGEEVLAVDDAAAVVRSADGRTVRAVTFGGGTDWRRAAGDGTTAALAPGVAIVATAKPARITAVSRSSGNALVDLRTGAKVFAATGTGMLLVSGRDMAYLPFR